MAEKILLKIIFILLAYIRVNGHNDEFNHDFSTQSPLNLKRVSYEQAFIKWLNDSGFIVGNKFHFPKNNLTLDWSNPKEKELIKTKIPRLKRKWLAVYCKHRPNTKICAKRKKMKFILAEELRKGNNATYDPSTAMRMGSAETSSWWEGPNVCIVKEHQYKNQKLFISKFIENERATKKGQSRNRMTEVEFLRQRKIIESSNNTRSTECSENMDKYVCATSLKVYGLSRHWNLIHQCCNNYKRDNITDDCVPEKRLNAMDTLRKIGLTDFKKIIIREKIHAITYDNITIFAPSNDMFRGLVGYKLSDSGYFDPKQISNMQFHKERDMLEKLRAETHIPAKKTVTKGLDGEDNENEGLKHEDFSHDNREFMDEYENSQMVRDREAEKQIQLADLEYDDIPGDIQDIHQLPVTDDRSKSSRLFDNIRERRSINDIVNEFDEYFSEFQKPKFSGSKSDDIFGDFQDSQLPVEEKLRKSRSKTFSGNKRVKRSLRIINGDFDDYVHEDLSHAENHAAYRRKKRASNGFVFMMKDVMLNQIVPGRVDLTRVRNDDVFSSYLEGSTVRINIFGSPEKPKYTANCVPFHKYITNMEASNGIIHIVNRLVPPVMNTIWDIIMQSENHSIFKKLIKNKNLSGLLTRKKPYTLLIPTDAAYKFIEEKSKHHLIEGSECGQAIIKNHIIPNVVLCASMIRSLNISTLEKNKLRFNNYYDKGIVINDEINVIKSDIMAIDGVIHVIDKFLIPDSGLLLSQVLKKYKFTHFQNILQSFADLSNFWDNMRRKTLFIPIDKALNTRTQSYFEKSFDDETYFNYLKYHISPYYYSSKDFVNNMLLDTQAEDTIGRINLYSTVEQFNQTEIAVTRITWNCMEIITKDIQCCGVMVHAINRVAIPPSGTIYDTLQANNEFSILFEILNGTEIADWLQDEELSATFLAPPNYILQRLSPKDMDTLLHDPVQANELLSHHLLKEVLCCAGIGNRQLGFTNEIQTYAGTPKVYSRDDMNHIHIGEAVVTVCDIMASNGVIHQISSFAIGTKKTGTISKSDIFPYITP